MKCKTFINGEETTLGSERYKAESKEELRQVEEAIDEKYGDDFVAAQAMLNKVFDTMSHKGNLDKLRLDKNNPVNKDLISEDEQDIIDSAISAFKEYSSMFGKEGISDVKGQTLAIVNFLRTSLITSEHLRRQLLKVISNEELDINDKKDYINGIKYYADVINRVNEELTKELGAYTKSDGTDFFSTYSGRVSKSVEKLTNLYNDNVGDIVATWLFESIPDNNTELSPFNKAKLETYKERLEEAEKSGNKKRVKNIQKLINEVQKQKISKDDIKDLLGNVKDANYLSFMFEAAGKSGDIVVAAFTKKIKEQRIKARSKFYSKKISNIQAIQDKYLSEITKTGNMKKMNDMLFDVVQIREVVRGDLSELQKKKEITIIDSYNDDTFLIESGRLQLNRWYSHEFDNELVTLNFNINKEYSNTEGKEDKTSLQVARDARKNFLKNNAQSYFKDEFYNLDDVLSLKAKSMISEVGQKIRVAEQLFYQHSTPESFQELLDAEKEKFLLRFEKDDNGNLTKEAIEIDAYFKKISERYEQGDFSAEDRKEANDKYLKHRKNRERQLDSQVQAGKITPREKDIILRKFDLNSRYVKILPEYYEEKNKHITEASKIRNKINARLKELGYTTLDEEVTIETYANRRKIRGNKKSADNEYMGDMYSEEEQNEINAIEDLLLKYQKTLLLSNKDKVRRLELQQNKNKNEKEVAELKRLNETKKLEDDLKKNDTIIKPLFKELMVVFSKMGDMSQKVETEFYKDTIEREKLKLANDIFSKNPDIKEDELSLEVEAALYNTDWWKRNHIKKQAYDSLSKTYYISYEPTSIWIKEEPVNNKFVIKELKSKYLKHGVKEELINENRDKHVFFDKNKDKGYVPAKNSKFDKESSNFAYASTSKAFPKGENTRQVLEELTKLWAAEQESLPANKRTGYSLPIVENRTMDRLTENGLGNSLRGIARQVTSTEDDMNEGLSSLKSGLNKKLNDKSGIDLYNSIPVRFTSVMGTKDISYDIFGILAKFSYENILRENMNDMLADSKMLLDSLDETNVEENKDSAFFKIKSGLGLSKTESIRKQHIKEIILSNIYGEYDKKVDVDILGTKINMNKVVGSANKIVALTTLGWKLPGAVVNFGSAEIQKLIMGVAGSHINVADIARGHAMFFKHANEFMADGFRFREEKSAFTSMVIGWNVLQGDYDNKIGSEFRKTFVKEAVESNLFSMNIRQLGESETQISLWLAIMSKHNVLLEDTKTGQIEEMNLFDAYRKLYSEKNDAGEILKTISLHDYEGKYKIYNSSLNKESGKYEKDGEFTFKQEVEKQLLVEDLNIELNGNYDKFNKPVFEKTVLGKGVALFRRFFTSMAVRRWGGASEARYNINKQDWEQGFYITTAKMVKILVQDNGETLSVLMSDPKYRKSVIQMLTELLIITSLFIASQALGDDDDKYDEYGYFHLHTLYLLKKMRAETETFGLGGYNELRRITQDPMVFMFQLDKFKKTSTALFDTLVGAESAYYKRDTPGYFKKGDSKLKANIFKLVGLRLDIFYPEQLLTNFNYGQRNR